MTPPPPEDPPRIPGHVVLRRIGAGSSGEVWLARSATGAWRAVKVIRRDRFEDERAFRREFEAVRRFERLSREHPGFIDILQTGWTDDDAAYFYVMELGDGEGDGWTEVTYQPRTLARVLQERGRLTADDCVELGRRLCEGLQALHAEGLIHRDVKPSNVVYAGGVPKLADIGTVIGTHEARSYVGTEGFIAPEGPNSAQADVYALGKLLYVAATGKDRRDFPDPGVAMESGPEAPRLRELNLVLLRACAAHPSRRYLSARQLQEDLERLQSGHSIRWQRRREAAVRGMAWVAGLLVVAVVARPWTWPRRWHASPPPPSSAGMVPALISTGQERMNRGDESGAMLCFAESLAGFPLGTAEDHVQRVRLRLLSGRIPDLIHAFNVGRAVASIAVSPDGKQAAIGDEVGDLTCWEDGRVRRLSTPGRTGVEPIALRYGSGRELIVTPQFPRYWSTASSQRLTGRILDADTGVLLGPDFSADGALAFDATGHVVAMATQAGGIEVMDARSGRPRLKLNEHSSRVVRIVFSPSSRRLATADRDGTIQVWTLPEGLPAGVPVNAGPSIAAMNFSPDEQRLVVVSEDRLHRTRLGFYGIDGKPAEPAAIPLDGRLGSLDVQSHGGRRVVILQHPAQGDASSVLSIRDGSAPGSILAEPAFVGPCRCLATSPDGRWLAAGGDEAGACIWDMATGKPVTAMLGHAGGVRAVAFSPDGSRLFTGGADGLVKVWDLARLGSHWRTVTLPGRLVDSWRNPMHPYPVTAAGDRHLFLATVRGGRSVVTCLDLLAGLEESLPPCPDALPSASFTASADGDAWAMCDGAFATSSSSLDIGVWRRRDGRWELERLPHTAPVVAASFASRPRRLTTIDAARRLRTWHEGTPARPAVTQGPMLGSAAVFSRDGSRLVTIEDGKVLRVVDTAAPGAAPVRIPMPDFIECVAVSADGTLVAAGVRGTGLLVSSCTDGRRVALAGTAKQQPIPTPAVLAWAPQGRRLISHSSGAEARLLDWDLDMVRALPGTGEGAIESTVAFGEDDRWMVVRSSHDAVWVTDAATGAAVSPSFRFASRVRHAMITRESRLVVLADPNEVHVLDLKPDASPAPVLRERAQWLSGRQWSGDGNLSWLGWDALRKPDPSLREGPGTGSPTQGASVAGGQARAGRRMAVTGHPPALAPRPASATARTIDLSRFYTHALEALSNGDLSALPIGLHRLGDVEFDLRGMMRLESDGHRLHWRRRGATPADAYPLSAVRGIPVSATCRRIHFLMGVDALQEDPGTLVATWRIHFGDGTSEDRPVRYGNDLLDWHAELRHDRSGTYPRPVWSGAMPAPYEGGVSMLYRVSWENPSPGKPVRALDFLLGSAISRPCCLAISLE